MAAKDSIVKKVNLSGLLDIYFRLYSMNKFLFGAWSSQRIGLNKYAYEKEENMYCANNSVPDQSGPYCRAS